jgi:RNA polymerase sigma-70 factor (ECF subfamily)
MDEATRNLLNRNMAALADGERRAFDPVYRTLWPVLVRFVAVMSMDRMIAEDIAQQALLRILGRASTFDRTKDALAWSMTIAVNEYRSYRRKLGKPAADQHEWALAEPIDDDTPER